MGLKKIDTKENSAEMMTKPLPTTKFNLYVDLVGLTPCLMCCALGHVRCVCCFMFDYILVR